MLTSLKNRGCDFLFELCYLSNLLIYCPNSSIVHKFGLILGQRLFSFSFRTSSLAIFLFLQLHLYFLFVMSVPFRCYYQYYFIICNFCYHYNHSDTGICTKFAHRTRSNHDYPFRKLTHYILLYRGPFAEFLLLSFLFFSFYCYHCYYCYYS